MSELLVLNGGRPRSTGLETAWDFGFVRSTPEAWQAAGAVAHDEAEDVPFVFPEDKAFLWEMVRAVCGGVMPAYSWQLTGSCTNSGLFNSFQTRNGIEAALREIERVRPGFTLLAYGQSRWAAFHDDSEGDGSTGAALAIALRDIGVPAWDNPLFPKPHFCGPAVVYDRQVELTFSSVRNHTPEMLAAAKKLTGTFGIVTTADQAVAELRRGRPLTWAGDWGGLMECELKGTPAVLFNRRAGVWNHQESCHGFWRHPTLGLIFYIMNNWYGVGEDMKVEWGGSARDRYITRILQAGTAYSVHGKTTLGEPEGGYWISAKDMEYQCRHGEVRSIVELTGDATDVGVLAI